MAGSFPLEQVTQPRTNVAKWKLQGLLQSSVKRDILSLLPYSAGYTAQVWHHMEGTAQGCAHHQAGIIRAPGGCCQVNISFTHRKSG